MIRTVPGQRLLVPLDATCSLCHEPGRGMLIFVDRSRAVCQACWDGWACFQFAALVERTSHGPRENNSAESRNP